MPERRGVIVIMSMHGRAVVVLLSVVVIVSSPSFSLSPLSPSLSLSRHHAYLYLIVDGCVAMGLAMNIASMQGGGGGGGGVTLAPLVVVIIMSMHGRAVVVVSSV